jgi:hypothetical protein
MQPFDPPPHWHSHQPPRTTPAPGTNPQYDALEVKRKHLCHLVAQTEDSLDFHNLRAIGLTGTLNAYRDCLTKIETAQADLLSAAPLPPAS